MGWHVDLASGTNLQTKCVGMLAHAAFKKYSVLSAAVTPSTLDIKKCTGVEKTMADVFFNCNWLMANHKRKLCVFLS